LASDADAPPTKPSWSSILLMVLIGVPFAWVVIRTVLALLGA